MKDYLSSVVNASLTGENKKVLDTGGRVKLPAIVNEDINRMQKREENFKFGAAVLMVIGLIPCLLYLFSL